MRRVRSLALSRLLTIGLTTLVSVGLALPATAAPGRVPASLPRTASAAARIDAVPSSVSDAVRCAQAWHDESLSRSTAVLATAIGMAESTCRSSAKSQNPPTKGCPKGSTDRGMWQINSCYHPEVSDSCAYDADCSAGAAYTISANGTDWSPWSTYQNGAYRQFLNDAATAVAQVYGGGGGGGGSWPTVRKGQSGPTVRIVQYLLDARGASITVDGDFGAATFAAVEHFQSTHGLSVDGVVGAATWSALVVTVKQGSTGDAVKAAQTGLVAQGYSVAVDGVFGAGTKAAVVSFQSDNGLPADGVVGQQTWKPLVS
jgi:peptidoglycan hydrolase-like protein with peptidoglycan-binding domain